MLIIALVLALIGLVALVFAVVTSNELVAWVCIGASVLGVLLLIVDAVRERQQGAGSKYVEDEKSEAGEAVDYPDEGEQGSDADDSAEKATEESKVSGDRSGEDTK